MNRDGLDPEVVLAEALKVSILRLQAARSNGAPLHPDDWAFGEDALVLALARLNTAQARKALLDLTDFELDNSVWDTIAEAAQQLGAEFEADVRYKITQAPCTQAERKQPYVPAMPRKLRDKQLQNWLSEMTPEAKAQIEEWKKRMESRK
jgi:hypothetical protein